MAKISVIGICGNSIFMNVDHFHEKGETLVANSVYEEIGGKGINQAIACAKMGAEVSFLCAIGDDADGEKCKQTAKAFGINGFFSVKNGLKTTFAVILTDKSGENQVTGYRNAELSAFDVISFEEEIAVFNNAELNFSSNHYYLFKDYFFKKSPKKVIKCQSCPLEVRT